MRVFAISCRPLRLMTAALALGAFLPLATPLTAQVSSFARSMAEAASEDEVVAAFYRNRNYQTLWTGPHDQARRNALLTAFEDNGSNSASS